MCSVGRIHPVWKNLDTPMDIKRATTKARLLCGVYILQSNRAAFNQFRVDPTCPLCRQGNENLRHFLLACSALHAARTKRITKLHVLELTMTDVLDSSSLPDSIVHRFEQESRKMIQRLHGTRSELITQ
jgi:hypothetical protein